MVTQALLIKTAQLFIFMLFGYILAKAKLLNDESSNSFARISLYLMLPSAMINAFDVELTPEIAMGIAIAFVSAIAVHIIYFMIDKVYTKVFKAGVAERTSIIYTNAGNIIIPMVVATLGEEWVVYTCAYLTVQQICIWSHCVRLYNGENKINIKKILLNVNIITIAAGFIMMLSGIRLPVFVKDITTPLANLLGPLGMVIAGIMIPKVKFKNMLSDVRVYRAVIMRMIVNSLIITLLMKLAVSLIHIPIAENVLFVSLLSSIGPAGATMLQFAQLYNKEPELAVSLNLATTLCCIITMPLMVMIYSL